MPETKAKYFDTEYVVTRDSKYDECKSGLPLAFVVPDGPDSAAKKRKATANAWAVGSALFGGPPDIGKSMPNVPSRGFRIVDWEGRYATDNKVVRVVDPRGFEVEIYIPNLTDLILNSDIYKGEIDADLVWIRDGANNRLVRADSEQFAQAKKNSKQTPKTKLRHAPGDVVVCQNIHYRYLGLMDVEYFVPQGEKVVQEPPYRSPNWATNPLYKITPERFITVSAGRRHVYIREDPKHRSDPNIEGPTFRHFKDSGSLEFRSSQMTTYEIVDRGHVPVLDGTQILSGSVSQYGVFYTEAGEIVTGEQLLKQFDGSHSAWYDQRYRKFWPTELCRVFDKTAAGEIGQSEIKHAWAGQAQYA